MIFQRPMLVIAISRWDLARSYGLWLRCVAELSHTRESIDLGLRWYDCRILLPI